MKICVGGGNGAAKANHWVLIEGLISAFSSSHKFREIFTLVAFHVRH